MTTPLRSQVFSTNGSLAASSCGAAALPQPIFEFGFPVSALWLVNTCGPRMFYRLDGQAATTVDAYLSCGALLDVAYPGFVTCGLGLTSTSTSTGAAGQPLYSVSGVASV